MRVVGHHAVYRDTRYYCGPGPSIVCGEEGYCPMDAWPWSTMPIANAMQTMAVRRVI